MPKKSSDSENTPPPLPPKPAPPPVPPRTYLAHATPPFTREPIGPPLPPRLYLLENRNQENQAASALTRPTEEESAVHHHQADKQNTAHCQASEPGELSTAHYQASKPSKDGDQNIALYQANKLSQDEENVDPVVIQSTAPAHTVLFPKQLRHADTAPSGLSLYHHQGACVGGSSSSEYCSGCQKLKGILKDMIMTKTDNSKSRKAGEMTRRHSSKK